MSESLYVYMVIIDQGLFATYLDKGRALEMARVISAVVAAVPVVVDYREYVNGQPPRPSGE